MRNFYQMKNVSYAGGDSTSGETVFIFVWIIQTVRLIERKKNAFRHFSKLMSLRGTGA